MKNLLQFLRTTLVGGILFLVPILVVVFLVEKALVLAHKIVAPLAEHLPIESLLGLKTPVFLAVALLVLFCFIAGLFARTVVARRSTLWLETSVLAHLPGYEFFKSVGANFLGAEDKGAYPVVLARIEDAWQLAFLVERLADGQVAVFVPGVPNPQSGSVYYLTEDRIKPTDIPAAAALKCLKRSGVGSKELLRDLGLGTTPAE